MERLANTMKCSRRQLLMMIVSVANRMLNSDADDSRHWSLLSHLVIIGLLQSSPAERIHDSQRRRVS